MLDCSLEFCCSVGRIVFHHPDRGRMNPIKIALVGAGSRSFGPATVRDVLLSEPLRERGIELVLMDVEPSHLPDVAQYAERIRQRLGANARIHTTTDLDEAVRDASFVVTAIEIDRHLYWSQDFHIPRHYGFNQVFGENGGPGGLFHALRNMGPTVEIARVIERLSPGGLLINYTNPEHKLCEAVSRLTSTPVVGLCHGVFMGRRQIAWMLEMEESDLETAACGINHMTWFQSIRRRGTG